MVSTISLFGHCNNAFTIQTVKRNSVAHSFAASISRRSSWMLNIPTRSSEFSVSCSAIECSPKHNESKDAHNCRFPPRSKCLFSVEMQSIMRAMKLLPRPAISALLLGIVVACKPYTALAASGGRIGGRAFSSHSSSSANDYLAHSRTSFSHVLPLYEPYTSVGGGGICLGSVFGVGVHAESGFSLLMMGLAAVILFSGLYSDHSENGTVIVSRQKTSIVKLQVGLLGLAQTLQNDLDGLAERADTSTSEGMAYVLTETVLALLRHPNYCISSCSSAVVENSFKDGEGRFNQISIEERGKLDEETLINVGNIKKRGTASKRYDHLSNEHIVVTILVAAEGVHKLPVITNHMNLKQALKKLASLPTDKILAVEVIWTPQDKADVLTEQEMLQRYPLLRLLS